MPELPEVETVRRDLHAALQGAHVAGVRLRRKDLRIPFPEGFARRVAGQTIRSVERRAKYLLIRLGSGDVLMAHLGMTGRFSVEPHMPKRYEKHDHVVLSLTDGRAIIYNDARRFGLMTLVEAKELPQHRLLANLGPEPLNKEFSAEYLRHMLSARAAPVKTVLMDQRVVVGVGNIYASEALFLARIHPECPAMSAANRSPELVLAIRHVLERAIDSGGSSLRDFLHVSGEAGYFQHEFNVYGRQGKPCFSCGIPLRSIRQAGRSSFFCPRCQK